MLLVGRDTPKSKLFWNAFSALHEFVRGSSKGEILDEAALKQLTASMPKLFRNALALSRIIPNPKASYDIRLRVIEVMSLGMLAARTANDHAYASDLSVASACVVSSNRSDPFVAPASCRKKRS